MEDDDTVNFQLASAELTHTAVDGRFGFQPLDSAAHLACEPFGGLLGWTGDRTGDRCCQNVAQNSQRIKRRLCAVKMGRSQP